MLLALCKLQPMDFKNFPFDSFDLLLELRFFDPTALIDTTDVFGKPHPGVTVFSSSGGSKVGQASHAPAVARAAIHLQ